MSCNRSSTSNLAAYYITLLSEKAQTLKPRMQETMVDFRVLNASNTSKQTMCTQFTVIH